MLSLVLRFHFIFQPCCNSRKQAYRFIPDRIWFAKIDFYQKIKDFKKQCSVYYHVSLDWKIQFSTSKDLNLVGKKTGLESNKELQY